MAVGAIEPRDNVFHARRTIDLERRPAACPPGLQAQFAEIADMIGMEMREEDARNFFQRHAPQQQFFVEPVPESTT
jgi:hypothetical protein